MKTGLVLEGGAMRGMFTAGVLDVFMENDIHFSGVAAVSAGAVFGCNLKSGQAGRVIRYNKRFCRDSRYVSLRSLLTTGNLYNADFCYNLVPNRYDPFDTRAYQADSTEFYVVATNVATGEPTYRVCAEGGQEDIRWMQASASMPLAAKMVEIDEQKYLDGGISDPVPLRFLESQGYEKNVVVLTRPKDYVKKKNSMLPILQQVYKDYPQLVDKLSMRHHDYNETIKYVQAQSRRDKAFIIQPLCDLHIGPVEKDPNELQRVYEMGRKTALIHLWELKAFLSC